ncbi:MAG: NUDIX hydrolase [Bacteroidales bacterium]|nr:NUDIX hydrolase [Bacteroidales bacterium]MBN2758115.1 NUDIX hydrolase [Bacteroidales bacterium]
MKILGKKIISKSKYLNFVAREFINQNGENDFWYSAERPNSGKTVIVAATVDDKIVVTKEFRVAIDDYEWSLPAGLVDGNEKPEETAIRELKEETNLDVEKVISVSPYLYNTAGMTNEVVSIVFVKAGGTINQLANESSEEIKTFLMNKSDIQNLINDRNKKFSAKAWLIFDRFIKEGISFSE